MLLHCYIIIFVKNNISMFNSWVFQGLVPNSRWFRRFFRTEAFGGFKGRSEVPPLIDDYEVRGRPRGGFGTRVSDGMLDSPWVDFLPNPMG